MAFVVVATLPALCLKAEFLHIELERIGGSRLGRDNGGRHGGGEQGILKPGTQLLFIVKTDRLCGASCDLVAPTM